MSQSGPVRLVRPRWRASLVLAATLSALSAGAQANVIKVAAAAVNAGGSSCSLIDAITAANSNAKSGACPAGDDKTNGGDVIVLSAGVYKIGTADDDWYGPNGLPPITSKITIVGDPKGTIIMRSANTGVSAFRIFYVGGGQSLSAYMPPQDGNGNVVSTNLPGPGNLTLINLTLENGLAQGGAGGSSSLGGGGGGLGAGGAIYNQGTLTLQGVTLVGNQALGGAGGTTNGTNSSAPGGGGGMSGNGDGFGNGGGFNSNGPWPDSTTPPGEFGNGGGPGQPGGVGGGGGNGKNGGFGGGGGGTIGAGGFGGGGLLPGGFGGGVGLITEGGGAGLGGAVFNEGGTVSVQNCTFTSNDAAGGAGGVAGFGEGDAFGAAIFNLNGHVTVTYSTLAGNTLSGAGVSGGAVYDLQLATPGSPAADASSTASLDVDSSIMYGSEQLTTDSSGNVTSSVATDCDNSSGTLSGGHDVLGPTSAACILGGDLFTSPDLLPLASNGGPTSTMAIFLIGSAFGAGNTATAPLLDQRGYLRDAAPDIGAYEVSNAPIAIPAISGLQNASAIAGGSASQQAFNLSGNSVSQPGLSIALTSSDTSIVPAASLTLSSHCGASLALDACSLSVKPTSKGVGTTVVTVSATNGYGQTGYANFTQTVIPPAPVAKGATLTTASGQDLTSTLSASEALNATLTYTIVTQPAHGTLKLNSPSSSAFTYTSDTGFVGSDSFSWKANDGTLDSNTATDNISVTLPPPPPGAPTVSNLSFDVTENTAFSGTLTATGSTSLSFAVGTAAGHGSVKITDATTGAFTYTPANGFTGSDSFTYTATDTLLKASSNPATVTLSITTTGTGGGSSSGGGGSSSGGSGSGGSSGGSGSGGANSVAPIASAQSLATYAGTPVKGTLAASDAAGNALTFTVTKAGHGTVTLSDPTTGAFSYSPAAGFTGSDSFSFTATDSVSKLVSSAAQVSLTVTTIPVSSKAVPLVGNASFTTYENTPLAGQLSASDAAGNALNYLRVTAPAHGVVTVTPGTGAFSYTPTTGYVGNDSFTFSVTDTVTSVSSAVATVSLTMVTLPAAASAPPVANAAAYAIYENPGAATGFTAAVTASEAAGDPLAYAVSTPPSHGSVGPIAADGSFTYTPNPLYIGADSFSFTARDTSTNKTSDPATITFTVSALPPPGPMAANLSVATYKGVTVAGVLPASDGNGNPLTYASTLPVQGNLTLNPNTGGFTYAPIASFTGPDSFTFTVTDNNTHAVSAPATVTLSVDPISGSDAAHTPPLANNASVTVYENTPAPALSSQVSGASAGSNTLTYTVLTQPTHGALSLTMGTGAYTYTPTATYTGADSFTFSVTDNGNSLTANATVSITVAAAPPPATPPQVNDAAFTLYQDQPLSGLLAAADAASNPVNFSVVQPGHGSVTLTATSGAFTYTPNAGFTGSDSFTFTAIDTTTTAASSAATVTLTVSPTPITGVAPLSSGASVSVYQGQVLKGRFAAVTVGGDALSYALKTQPAHGSIKVTAASGAYSYSPTAGYAGKDSFSFVATDKTTHLMSSAATIAVAVVAPPLQAVAPLANGLALSVYSGQPINSAVSAVDVNGNPVAYAVTTKPKDGTLTLDAGSGGFSYTPATGFTGSDSFAYTATDTVSKLSSTAAQVEITVVPAPPAPAHHGGPSLTGKGSYGGLTLMLLALLSLWRRRRWVVLAAFSVALLPAAVLSDDAPAPVVEVPITDAWYVGGDANLIKPDSKRDASGGGFKGWGLLVGRDLGDFALEFDGEYHADAPKALGDLVNWKTYGADGLWYFQEHKSDAFSPFLDGGVGLADQYRGDDSKVRSAYLKFGAGINSAPWRSVPLRFRADLALEHVFSGYNDLLLSLGVEFTFGGSVPPPAPPAMPQSSRQEQYPMAWCTDKGGQPTETDAGWVCDLPDGRTESRVLESAPPASTLSSPSAAPAAGTLSAPSVVTYPQPPAARH